MAHIVKRKLKGGDRFYIRYAREGKIRWLAAGANRRAAERLRDQVAAKVLEGKFGLIVDKSDWTVAKLLEHYLKHMDMLKPRSSAWRRDRSIHLSRLLGDLYLENVAISTLERYSKVRLEEGAAVSSVNGEVAIMRHAIGRAVAWKDETGLHENRVADGWRPIKGRARAPRFLEPGEVSKLLSASAERGGDGDVFLRLFLATGARPGELLSLKPEDIGEETLRLPALKGGTSRIVVADRGLLAEVRESIPRWTKQRVRKHWEHARKAVDGAVRFYDMRHTVASEMLRRGSTVRDVQRLFGHQSARMTERYAHFSAKATALPSLVWGAPTRIGGSPVDHEGTVPPHAQGGKQSDD
jgi:integrase